MRPESLMAKMVELGDARNISGERWRRVAMMLKPEFLNADEAPWESWRMATAVEVAGDESSSPEEEWKAVVMATKANTAEMMMKRGAYHQFELEFTIDGRI